jgi:ferric-dicitrate binding protein FerR (iron transport regulator)
VGLADPVPPWMVALPVLCYNWRWRLHRGPGTLEGSVTIDSGRGAELSRRSFGGIAFSALLAASRGAKAQNPERVGLCEYVRGEASAEGQSARRALQRDAPVFVADLVSTGPESRLTIHLGENTRLRLGERARIIIDRYLVDAGGEFRLEAGAMLFDRPSGQPLPVRVRSPFGLIAVRGTRFFAGPSAHVFGVFVERGTVAVGAAGREVTVSPGQGTDISRPGEPPTPVKAWGEPRIREALASVF